MSRLRKTKWQFKSININNSNVFTEKFLFIHIANKIKKMKISIDLWAYLSFFVVSCVFSSNYFELQVSII